ncbi:MAG: DUF4391 domain-containing protein [Culicoidibacterales bacterium]
MKWWGFPRATIINRNLPKTQIYPHMKNAADRQFLQDSVKSICLLASIKTDNTHIAVYEDDKEIYQEIQFLYVKTKDKDESTKIYKLLAQLIPYPLVILTDEPDSFTIIAGRYEKLSTGFLKLISVYASPNYQDENLEEVLQQINLINLPRVNLKTFYCGLVNEVATATAKEQYGETVGYITGKKKDQLDVIKKQIKDLRSQIMKERQLNRKIELQMKLKKLKDEFSNMIKQ